MERNSNGKRNSTKQHTIHTTSKRINERIIKSSKTDSSRWSEGLKSKFTTAWAMAPPLLKPTFLYIKCHFERSEKPPSNSPTIVISSEARNLKDCHFERSEKPQSDFSKTVIPNEVRNLKRLSFRAKRRTP